MVAWGGNIAARELQRKTGLKPRAVLDTRPDLEPEMQITFAQWQFRRLSAPTIGFSPVAPDGDLARARARLADYDWVVLTSKRGAEALLDGVNTPPRDVRWAAVGPTTAEALRSRGVTVDCVPKNARGDSIPGALAEFGDLAGRRILLARADAADDWLPQRLRGEGAEVDEVVAYETVIAPEQHRAAVRDALLDPEVEAVMFASGSAVRGLIELAGDRADAARRLKVFTIGPKTSAVARQLGFKVTGEAQTQDSSGLNWAVVSAFEQEVTEWVESQFPKHE